MKITTYKQARKYLENLIRFTIYQKMRDDKHLKDPLERMRVLLDLLENPERRFMSVLVGGTTGKGSTAYLTSHILTVAGYNTGFFMKPHLQKINERIQVNEFLITNKTLVAMLNDVSPIIDKMKKMRVGQPSYFELLVAMAFQYFVDNHVDIAIVEVGLGGEYDATNTLEPLISVLTKVSLDHTEYLGKTVQKIAQTKAGIVKKIQNYNAKIKSKNTNTVVVTGVRQRSVIKIVEDRCKEVGAELFRLGKDFHCDRKKEGIEGSVFDFIVPLSSQREQIVNLQLSLIGGYQVENASLAIEVVLQLRNFGFKVSLENIRKALQTAFFPGHFEIVNYTLDANRYLLVLDGAHNPEKMKAFISSLKNIYPKERKIFILGFKKSKDANAMLKTVFSVADIIIATEFYTTTDMAKNAAMEAESIKYKVSRLQLPEATTGGGQVSIKGRREIKVFIKKKAKHAVNKAIEIAKNDSIIVVTGSLYLVGEVRGLLGLKYSTEKVGN